MANAASQQAVEVGKERLREFLDHPDAPRNRTASPVSAHRVDSSDNISLRTLDSHGKTKTGLEEDD
jgi:hypothetical protein